MRWEAIWSLGFQLPALKLLMPLGISFYTLSAVGYVIDVYRGQTAADHHFGRLALFLSLFTNITEGPISRYDQLAGQAFEGHRADYLAVYLWRAADPLGTFPENGAG